MAKNAAVIGAVYPVLVIANRILLKKFLKTPRHSFAADSALIYIDTAKGRGRRIYPDRVREWKEREVIFKDAPFHFFTVTFKDTITGWLPDQTVVEFGIPKAEDLTRLREWIDRHSLIIQHETKAKP